MLRTIVGDTTPYLSVYANQHYDNVVFVQNSNYTNTLNDCTVYTSLGDLDECYFIELLSNSTEIIYHPPSNNWSSNTIQNQTEMLLNVINTRNRTVKNFNNLQTTLDYEDIFLTLPYTERVVNTEQLWIVGCSITQGFVVTRSETYADKLSKRIKLPYTNLGINASSNRFHATQILKADIKEGDVVFWGLTSNTRMPLFGETDTQKIIRDQRDNLIHVTPKTFTQMDNLSNYINPEILSEERMIYETVLAVQQVNNFCRKLGVKLFIGGLFNDERTCHYFNKFENFVQLYTYSEGFLDKGTDDEHPGPKTHEWYTSQFFDLYNRVK